MKLRLLCVGKLTAKFLRQGAEEFAGRAGRYLPLEVVELKEEKGGGKKPDPAFIRDREGERILSRIPPDAYVVALDEKGTGLTSEGLAAELEKHMVQGTSEVVFV
ncbi:MAG: 23S rRNA (pseudouridine(1915)-N(3))-methyltransferase RlmH, partial [Desulfuromonadales bacterium]|nr:23S rRNA (pseudouridine(1915)-N(3))-methyltransferase RlmH [Desulfuromonadales bacterium]NIS43821.1 23S rRNA (pseudouridine(1915)-N(3))-methyltransferase RlmH [Desulfuromonadales bacterium]